MTDKGQSVKFPPIVDLPRLEPWGVPQTMEARPTGMPSGKRGPNRPGVSEVFDAHRYATLNGSINLAVATTSALVLSSPTVRRNFLALRNTSATANVYVEFGNDATTNAVFKLTPGTMVLFDTVCPQDDVFAIADAVSASLSVTYSNLA